MFRNYIKVAYRYLLRHKVYTAINTIGLAVGVTCCILIMLFVRSEFSYDEFHTRADRIYRVWQHEKYQGEDLISGITSIPMAPAIQATFPEVETTCRVYAFSTLVKVDGNVFNESMQMVDSTFFKVFDFKLAEGNRQVPFPSSNSVILTTEMAKKYFGNANAVGKTLEIQFGNEKVAFTIAGIAQPSPEESSIKYSILLPTSNLKWNFSERTLSSWFNISLETYILLKPGVDATVLEKKFPAMMKHQLADKYVEGNFTLHLQNITDMHLDTRNLSGIQPVSNPKYSYILTTIGVLILLVACINFITLSIGRSTTRSLEVGVRKVLGAEKKQLIWQFWGEAFLLTIAAVIIALILSAVLITPFNNLIERKLRLQLDVEFLAFALGIIAVIAFVAGIYPAVVLSRFNPVQVLKGTFKSNGRPGMLRQSLIIGQFVASIAMIICTIIISKQMKYLQEKNLGYNKEQVIVVPTNKRTKEGFPLAQLYRTELLKHPQVASVTTSIFSFAETPWMELGYTDKNKSYRGFQANIIDAYFLKTMGIQVVQGRDFEPSNSADVTGSIIVNEAFVKEFGLKDPIGKKVGPFDQNIIGVVKDFNFESLHSKIRPLMLGMDIDTLVRKSENVSYNAAPRPRLSVRMKAGNIADNLAILKDTWRKIAPGQDFEYQFLDQTIIALYAQEQRTSDIIRIASGLSIFIACMGLFGLATLTVTRRTKEIGVRKVLGATVPHIVMLIFRDFLKVIVIAAVIAIPVGWWAMNKWLEDFEYRVPISWWVFVLAMMAALVIAFITVSFQSVRAATANPVKNLRTE